MAEEIRRRKDCTEVFKRYNFYDYGFKYGIQHMDTDLEIFIGEANEGIPCIKINGINFDELP